MNISIVRNGYVRTTVAAFLADCGHQVVSVDGHGAIIEDSNDGVAPIHQPGLDGLVAKHGGERLRATTNYEAFADTDMTFLALSTPSTDHGGIDLSTMNASTRSVGNLLAEKE